MEQKGGQQAEKNASDVLHHLLHDPRGRMVRVETLVVVGTVLLCLLAALGSHRRRSTAWCVKILVWAAYTLVLFMFTYTIGFMQSSSIKSELYPVWAVSFFAALGGTNSITAYDLDDNKQWMRHLAQLVLYYTYISMMIGDLSDAFVIASLVLLVITTYYKNVMRIFSCVFASRSWSSCKVLADYMKLDADPNECQDDPISLQGYRYLVFWVEAKTRSELPYYRKQLISTNTVVTIEQIWHCDGRLMKSSEGTQLKDTCLSFALCHLLRRRYFGFSCAESGLQKTHDFVFRGLLAREEDCSRAFKVIEVELHFLYDFFFTKYALMHYQEFKFLFLTMISVTLTFLVGVAVNRTRGTGHSLSYMTTVGTKNADIDITMLILATLALLEILQLILYWLSEWGRVSLTCKYVIHPWWQNNKFIASALAYLCRLTLFGHWQNKIGQYSLLESFQGNSCIRRLNYIMRWSIILYARDLEKIGINMTSIINGRKAGVPTNVSSEVKKAIVQSLKLSNGQLFNGVSSLARHGLNEQLSWACRQETQTHTILIWHIATTYCEIAPPDLELELCESQDQVSLQMHRDVATKLSRYCAYLVVFVPELLPDHQYDTKSIFDEVEKEAMELLGGERTLQDKYQVIRNLGEQEEEETIFVKGAKLGKQLESITACKERWMVIVDFWAEMILYIAPSDNVRGHIEHLTSGGEFVTHLWALLTHAGIVERNQDSQNL